MTTSPRVMARLNDGLHGKFAKYATSHNLSESQAVRLAIMRLRGAPTESERVKLLARGKSTKNGGRPKL